MPGLGSSTAANVFSAISAAAACFAVVVSCQANDVSQKVFEQSRKPEGAILAPAGNLSGSLCYRFSGYAEQLPANSTLWLLNRTADSPQQYPTEVQLTGKPTDSEVRAAQEGRPDATAWVGSMQIGDARKNEGAIDYVAALYWADPVQSQYIRDHRQDVNAIPSDVYKQALGREVHLSQPAHPEIPQFSCNLQAAR